MSISRRGPGATNTDKVTGDLTRLSWEKLDSKITSAKPLAIIASTQNGHFAIDLAMFAVQPKRQSFFRNIFSRKVVSVYGLFIRLRIF